ncbi:hypothetical protein EWM64_g7905 [Hericium alpestre]|uniref:FMN hydroxy acid dehydrogenase domain-containing protein n=1 Tax=Hericium alpestre TaxID=135208 RepID=A0A4Y9ZPX4_9AGAM|nr:hypothetical protein EWM64_g7905 [Hericium alpestre]
MIHDIPCSPLGHPLFPFPFYPSVLQSRIERGDKEAAEAHTLGKLLLQETNSGEFKTWDQLKLLQDNWDGPIILKGIQHVDDAIKAIDVGISGIIISNHGGRQVDGALPSIIALENITADQRVQDTQRAGKFTVLFDSGIRTGSDVLKAIALGAQAVLVARPFMYGLAINGETGVEEVLRGLLADTEISLGLSGYKDINDIWYKKEDFMIKVLLFVTIRPPWATISIANYIAKRINTFNPTPEKPFVLGLPTGSPPIPTYKALIKLVKEGKLSYVHGTVLVH